MESFMLRWVLLITSGVVSRWFQYQTRWEHQRRSAHAVHAKPWYWVLRCRPPFARFVTLLILKLFSSHNLADLVRGSAHIGTSMESLNGPHGLPALKPTQTFSSCGCWRTASSGLVRRTSAL